jgi:glycerol-3-phosphate dehydrogenase
MKELFDVAIIGGGINGCGVAADAALRGLSVVLCDKSDLASHTSSASSKLIHGGLRYLEQYEFSLVKKGLTERQVLLNIAPHLIKPLQFIVPQQYPLRNPWFIRLGLFLYDNLSRGNRLPKSRFVTRAKDLDFFNPLKQSIKQGFSYYDCATFDARLTLANALQAKQHGAAILPHHEVASAHIVDGLWHINLQSKTKGESQIIARSLVNATGPFVTEVNALLNIANAHALSLVKGSHILLPPLYKGEHAYLLQHPDKRIVFTIPYFGYTLVGTTDVPFKGSADAVQIDNTEIEYLLDIVKRYFDKKVSQKDIISTYSGVRPLLYSPNQSAQTLSRDYLYHFSQTPAPCVSIFGGKITTYRLLAKEVVDHLSPVFPNLNPSITHLTPLPGATQTNSRDFLQKTYPWLSPLLLEHYIQTYGTRTHLILQDCDHPDALGMSFTPLLYQREVDYLIREEWASTVDDILWRRTQLGLTIQVDELKKLRAYVEKVGD